MMPSESTTAKPRTGPVPNVNSTTPAIRVVRFASAIAENAFSKPALIAAYGLMPLRNSSRMRSKIRMFASTAMPTVSTMPAIPGSDSDACSMDSSAASSTTFESSTTLATRPNFL